MIFEWFKSKEEREGRKKQEDEQKIETQRSATESKIKQEKAYDTALEQVIITPESKDSYERRRGYSVEVIDTNDRNKGIIFINSTWHKSLSLDGDFKLKRHLVEARIEAIVEANYSRHEHFDYYYGLPVAKKNGGPYR